MDLINKNITFDRKDPSRDDQWYQFQHTPNRSTFGRNDYTIS